MRSATKVSIDAQGSQLVFMKDFRCSFDFAFEPTEIFMAHEQFQSCIAACVACAQECEHCGDRLRRLRRGVRQA